MWFGFAGGDRGGSASTSTVGDLGFPFAPTRDTLSTVCDRMNGKRGGRVVGFAAVIQGAEPSHNSPKDAIEPTKAPRF